MKTINSNLTIAPESKHYGESIEVWDEGSIDG
jgi:hypothetical protein